MSMEVTAWNAMYNAMHAQSDRRPFSRASLRRIAEFARPTAATSACTCC